MIWMIISVVIMLALIAIVLLRRSRVSATKRTDRDLGEFKTYAFLPESSIHWPSMEKKSETDVSKTVVDTVNNNMKRIGYTLELNHPDLLVVLKTNKTSSSAPLYASFPYSGTLPVNPVYSAYAFKNFRLYNEIANRQTGESTYKEWLQIDIIERKTKKVLWTATSNQSIYVKKTSEELIHYLNSMFKQYPSILE